MSIFNETQLDRDIELAKLLDMPLEEIQKLAIATPDSIRVYDKEEVPKNYIDLYKDYKYLDFTAYLKTLMNRSMTSRHPELFKLLKETKNKTCLDFGSGVGSHSIALAENNNDVTLLDVEGSLLLDFAIMRLLSRGYNSKYYTHNRELPSEMFDVVICSDCLEHVPSPLSELRRIYRTLKPHGILHLLVSTMRKKSSGHFDSSIDEWLKCGKRYVSDNFIEIRPTIYRKI